MKPTIIHFHTKGLKLPSLKKKGRQVFQSLIRDRDVERIEVCSKELLKHTTSNMDPTRFYKPMMLFPDTPNICLHWGGLGGECRHIWHTWSVWDLDLCWYENRSHSLWMLLGIHSHAVSEFIVSLRE